MTSSAAQPRQPLYPRLLRVRHLHLSAWQRALLSDGMIALAVVLVLADLASGWTLLVLPLAVAVVVKGHDVLAGALAQQAAASPAERLAQAFTAAPAALREVVVDLGEALVEHAATTITTAGQPGPLVAVRRLDGRPELLSEAHVEAAHRALPDREPHFLAGAVEMVRGRADGFAVLRGALGPGMRLDVGERSGGKAAARLDLERVEAGVRLRRVVQLPVDVPA